MSASSLLSLSSQALFTAYRQVQTTSHNIANANTEGYSRQTNVQATMSAQDTGVGYLGRGVTIASVQRAANAFLTDRVQALQSAAAADATAADLQRQLENVFTGGEAGLGYAATEIFNAFSDLAATPSDLSARQAVVGRLEDFASAARNTGELVTALQANVMSDLKGSVSEVNGYARQIADLNRQIGIAVGAGHQPNDLLDQRDLLVQRLAEQIDVQTVQASDGQVSVFVATGQSLVVGTVASTVVLKPDPYDATRAGIGIEVGGELTLLADDFVQGGKIGGLLRFQNTDLNDARNRLGQFVAAVAGSLNEQQTRGLDLSGTPGTALFTLSPPRALPASTNAVDGSGQPLAALEIERADVSALKASEYRVTGDPADSSRLLVTRLADGPGATAVSIASGDVYDGLRFTIAGTAPQTGDSFLVQGVSDIAASAELALKNPRGLAAAGPMTAVVANGNHGTMQISAIDVADSPSVPYAAANIRFTGMDPSDSSGRNMLFEVTDGSGSVIGNGTFTPGTPLQWNGLELTLSGAPKVADAAWPGDPTAHAGDRISLSITAAPASNNSNALTLDGLASLKLVDGETAAEAWAALFAQIGVRAQSTSSAADATATSLSLATEAVQAVTGVNVDEEVARLLQHQQGYQAAAKILQTAQTLLDSLIGMVGN
ncbi:MAG: flagellar hook-associated protein FlgK [Burkholderiaceae bacterium]|nr:flagellar hook-associated protein FlgK [Burkholderiaceae bacterium]